MKPKAPIGFIPSWPRLLNKPDPPEGDLIVVPAGGFLPVEGYREEESKEEDN